MCYQYCTSNSSNVIMRQIFNHLIIVILSIFLVGLITCSIGIGVKNENDVSKSEEVQPTADISSSEDYEAKDKDSDVKVSSLNLDDKQRTLHEHKINIHEQSFEQKNIDDKPNKNEQTISNPVKRQEHHVNTRDRRVEDFNNEEHQMKPDELPNSNNNLGEPTTDLHISSDESSMLQDNKKQSADSFVIKFEHEAFDSPSSESDDKTLKPNADQTKNLQIKQVEEVVASPIPPPLQELTIDKEALERKEKSNVLYEEGMKLINSSTSRSAVAKGYQLLNDATDLGHVDAEVEIGFAHLMGAFLPLQISKARKIFEKHAASGNPRAQAGLGIMYATGIGTNSSQAKALVYLTFSALGNDVMGRMVLGYRYSAGIGVAKSCETALNYYRTVADQVASNVKVGGGSILMRVRLLDEVDRPGSNYGTVDEDLVQYYQFLADKGDIPAQVTLGQLNYQGSQGFDQNLGKAFEYFSKAAEAGNANALGYLGKIYSEGTETIKQNNVTALRYFKQAAEKGNPIGHAGLGLMYLYGKGVDIDHEKAFKHFQSSADQGWPEGQLHLGSMYFNGLGVKRDFKQALRCFNLAAQNGHLLALYYLAQMHSTGNGVARNCQTATELYKNVCERGRWSSMFELGYKQYKSSRVDSSLAIYMLLAELGYEVAQSNAAYILDQEESGLFPNQTYARALIHWDRAAEQGYSTARLKLGDYHYYGKGTEVDYEIAASHYKVAVEQSNNAQAMFNIGYMHEQGLGMKRDIHLAKRHYDMAAEASGDAVAPVTLALLKLGFLFAFELLESKEWFNIIQWSLLSQYLSDDWDLYLMTLLALILGFVVAYRRQRR